MEKLVDHQSNNMFYGNIREEELKNKVGRDYFEVFDTTKIIGNVDFCVTFPANIRQQPLFENQIQSLLWAEAKINLLKYV